MDPITLALTVAEFVPSIVGWFTGDDKDADKAEGVLEIVKQVTGLGVTDGIGALRNNPDLVVKLKSAVMDFQIKMEQENTKQLQAVNNTMIAEGKSEHWMQWSWRPFNGYLFGSTLLIGYVLPAVVNVAFAAFHVTDRILEGQEYIDALRVVPYASIPEFVLASWAAILGVSAFTRGKEKLANVAGKLL